MRIEIDKYGNRNEYSDEGKWLYQDRVENDRYFTTVVFLGKNEEPWPECTNEKKEQWQEWKREHLAPEPEPEQEGGEVC